MMRVETISPLVNFKITMFKSSLCDYSDAHIHLNRTIKGAGVDEAARLADERNKWYSSNKVFNK